MFKTIFSNISDHRLIILEDAGYGSSDELFKILPALTGSAVSWVSAPDGLKTPTLASQVNEDCKVVFIESISPFLWTHGVRKIAHELKDLTARGKVVVVHVHLDTLLEEGDGLKLRYLSTTVIRVLKQLGKKKFLVRISLRKKHQTEIVEILGNDVTSSVVTHNVEQSVAANPVVTTTFNLGVNLSETEKQAKDSLILPYLRNKQEGSTIIYNADEADLEEDPDEDLEL